ncbi:MAG TPA: hypothetical protein VNJ01_02790 [Bacteriovoracaceae bacterium]|nr:hypothetical protein [Bacteriovoracaceae bacterium]
MIPYLKALFILLLLTGAAHAARKRVIYQVYDKISLIKHPLMLKTNYRNSVVTFSWSEPHWDFKYFLELYRKGQKKPFNVSKVRGGIKKMKFKKQRSQVFWRIVAKSRYGNSTTNKKIFYIPLK